MAGVRSTDFSDSSDEAIQLHTILAVNSDGDIAKRLSIVEEIRTHLIRLRNLLSIVGIQKMPAVSTTQQARSVSIRSDLRDATRILDRLFDKIKPSQLRHDKYTLRRRDHEFLEDAKRQLRKQKWPKKIVAGYSLRIVLKHIENVQQPSQKHNDGANEQRDAYFLSPKQARDLVESNASIDTPIFTFCAENLDWNPYYRANPIASLLNRFALTGDVLHYDNPEQMHHDPSQEAITISELKARFGRQSSLAYPLNFVEIPSPLPSHIWPNFLRGVNASFLTDLRRLLLEDKTDLTRMRVLLQHWERVEQVFLCAEAGALTPPHYDPFGYATWICCLDGEIGFAWLSAPSDEEFDNWLANEDEYHDKGTWFYRVLRPGDTVYFPSGTIHYVFRLPEGKPTHAASGQLPRQNEIVRWLTYLSKHVKDADTEGENHDLHKVVPLLLDGLEELLCHWKNDAANALHTHNLATSASRWDLVNVDEVNELIEEIDRDLWNLFGITRQKEWQQWRPECRSYVLEDEESSEGNE